MVNGTKGGRVKRLLFSSIISIILLTHYALAEDNRLSDTPALQERIGESVPLDVSFSDERGETVRLGKLIDRPVILTLVYFNCEHLCPQVLGGLAEVLGKLDLTPGRDYRVITLSFDEDDTPGIARQTKENYQQAAQKSFPEDSWKFLSGGRESIEKVTAAVGLNFRKEGHGFVHPVVAVILSPEGKITRYIPVSKYLYGVAYPITFSPVELTAALTEASQGKVGIGSTKSVLFCFPHEPSAQGKFFRLLEIVGTVTLLGMIALFVYLWGTTRKARKAKS